MVWSIGASIDTDSRVKFDTFLREILTGKDEKHPIPTSIGKIDNAFPTDGLVYDFLFEVIDRVMCSDVCYPFLAIVFNNRREAIGKKYLMDLSVNINVYQ